ncbi:hypothetical protein R1sor_003729 [Riccia sorocarpa]|uniref:Uncharacterized protein n=1 Tax=Riccia sorocarpa TaxID=122646 RepID=A0ABD3H588_9MARC
MGFKAEALGIPPPEVPFRLRDGKFGKTVTVLTSTSDKPADVDLEPGVILCKNGSTLDSSFQLTPRILPSSESYHILNLRSGLALTEEEGGELVAKRLNSENERQAWCIIASKIFPDGSYYVQNYRTKRFLLFSPLEEVNRIRTGVLVKGMNAKQRIFIWSFSFSMEGGSVSRGIPPTQTQFRLMHLGTGRFLRGGNWPVMEEEVNEFTELHFRLVAPKRQSEKNIMAYLIQSVYASHFLTASVQNGEEFDSGNIEALKMDEGDLHQFWDIIPSNVPVGSYRIRNCCTKGYLHDEHKSLKLLLLSMPRTTPNVVMIEKLSSSGVDEIA